MLKINLSSNAKINGNFHIRTLLSCNSWLRVSLFPKINYQVLLMYWSWNQFNQVFQNEVVPGTFNPFKFFPTLQKHDMRFWIAYKSLLNQDYSETITYCYYISIPLLTDSLTTSMHPLLMAILKSSTPIFLFTEGFRFVFSGWGFFVDFFVGIPNPPRFKSLVVALFVWNRIEWYWIIKCFFNKSREYF